MMKANIFTPFQPTLTPKGQALLGLNVTLCPPDKRLAATVFAFVQVKIDQPTLYPVVPDGTNVLFFSHNRQLFGGTQSAILEVPLHLEQGEYFGVWFYPGAIRHFFAVDAAEVVQQITELDYLDQKLSQNLAEQLYEKESFAERIQLCESLLLQRLRNHPLSHKFAQALDTIYRTCGQCSVQNLAANIGWSHRHLNRQFLLHTGLSVKAFAQTIRLNEYLKRCYQSIQRPLNHGLDLGFYDQSHLIKTIKQHKLTALSPKAKEVMSSFYNPSY